jgi:DNA-binding transcriptional LysR family regulator
VDLRQFEYFLAVADELHFGRAAARLHVGAATVTEQIQRLELSLGGPLFARTTRRVALTPLGEIFAVEARRAVQQFHHALSVGRSTATGGGVPLRLGLALDVAQDLLADALDRFRRRLPDQGVVPQSMRSADQIEALLSRRLHLGITWEPPVHHELNAVTLSTEPFLVMVPVGHPLDGASCITPLELAGWPLVMWSRELNEWTYDRFMAAFSAAGVSPTVTYTAWGADAMAPLISSGLGLGVTTKSIVSTKRYVGISFVPLAAPAHECRRIILSRKDETHPGVNLLIESLIEVPINE